MRGGTAKRLEFEYTGTYNERLDDGVVELLSTGTLMVTKDTYIDAFLVGGGASGTPGYYTTGYSSGSAPGGGGGASGCTKVITNAFLQKNVEYPVVIGAGGPSAKTTAVPSQGSGNSGGDTSAFGYTAKGGQKSSGAGGGTGGSGGGGGGVGRSTSSGHDAGAGGADGANGAEGYGSGGTGQGTTTREFGESTGKLYAGGGGGGRGFKGYDSGPNGAGGAGGGGDGAKSDAELGGNGEANTGSGGGGGGGNIKSERTASGSGGSGIVCIRLHKE